MSSFNLRVEEEKKEEKVVEKGGRKRGRMEEGKTVEDQERERGPTPDRKDIISRREFSCSLKEERAGERQHEADK